MFDVREKNDATRGDEAENGGGDGESGVEASRRGHKGEGADLDACIRA